jgi:hypothetical protein
VQRKHRQFEITANPVMPNIVVAPAPRLIFSALGKA